MYGFCLQQCIFCYSGVSLVIEKISLCPGSKLKLRVIHMRKLLTEPLFHFILIGAALFIVFGLSSRTGTSSDDSIYITQAEIRVLQANFDRTWQRPPTEEELAGLIEERIRDELASREAVKMGLDQNDTYIRRRLRMKMEMLMEDRSMLTDPSEKELSDFLDQNRDSFRRVPRVSFSHVYLNTEKHSGTLEEDIRQLLQQLNEMGNKANPENFGDAIMLPKQYPLSSVNIIARQFGREFTDDIVDLEAGRWQGPIASSYGLHLVLVHESVPGRDPDLSEVRAAVEREFEAQRRKLIKKEVYQKLKEQYQVEIEQVQAAGV